MIARDPALGSRGAADLDLLQRWRTGDTRAGERLCERYFDLLWRFFHHRAQDDAADLIQRTMLDCVESVHRDVPGGNVRVYLLGVARRVLLKHDARERVRRVDALVVSPVDDPSNSARSLPAMREDQRRLACALRQLPLDLQLVVELMDWEALPLAEVAAIVEVPVRTVKSDRTSTSPSLA
jgi:RNA polymerase sigma factor (sigma-70 family)